MRSDAELILASGENPAAFRELYDRWAEPLLRYLVRRVFDPETAADLLAETFAVAYERRHRFRDVGRPGAAWLYGIAAKELSHFFRRREVELRAARRLGLERPALDEESETRIAALVEGDEYRVRLREALSRLPDQVRQAVELRVVDELGYEQIAARLECNREAARTRVHRGLARLNELMEEPS
ncbi:MAG: RNA polymerase sigma factor [Solirubrobacteraceae bacterium]